LQRPPPLQVPLQQSEAIVHEAPLAAQQRLVFMSQLFEQQSVFTLHPADTAAHMLLASPLASFVELLSVAEESPGDWPSVCICASAGGDCESCVDPSGTLCTSIELGAS
jgi:hypothetical protein